MIELIQFAFIVVLPLIIVGGAVASLFAIGALFEALEDPQGLRARIEGAFRRPPRPARTPGPGHYYRPHWLGVGKPEVQANRQQP
jgi:hypothetical protein